MTRKRIISPDSIGHMLDLLAGKPGQRPDAILVRKAFESIWSVVYEGASPVPDAVWANKPQDLTAHLVRTATESAHSEVRLHTLVWMDRALKENRVPDGITSSAFGSCFVARAMADTDVSVRLMAVHGLETLSKRGDAVYGPTFIASILGNIVNSKTEDEAVRQKAADVLKTMQPSIKKSPKPPKL